MEDLSIRSIIGELFNGWKRKMTFSALLMFIGISSYRITEHAALLFWSSIALLAIFLCYAVVELIRDKKIKINELEDRLRPKLSILFVENRPYVESVKEIGSIECRKIRVGIKNNSLVKVSKVRVKIENCVPSSKAILLKRDLMPTGAIAPITIGPEQEELFDVIAAHDAKHSHVTYNMTGPDASIDKQEYELEISANCEESVPATARFRIDIGQDGFFVMRRIC